MASRNKVRVAVLGASGYSGIEAVRIRARRPMPQAESRETPES